MSNKLLISIVVPTYNRKYELARCIESVISQTYQEWELLVIDDRSTDESFETTKKLYESERRISFIQRPAAEAKGANVCRNIGIDNATGSYIAFLDSDDCWAQCRLRNVVSFIQATNALAIYSGAKIVSTEGTHYRKSRSVAPGESLFDFLLSNDTYSQTSSMVLNSSILSDVKFDEILQRHQDFDFFIRVGRRCTWSFFESDEVIVYSNYTGVKKIDFLSCVKFYEIHKEISLNASLRVDYLNYISESCAKINPNIEALRFYRDQLCQEGVDLTSRQLFLFNFPYLFQLLYRLKNHFSNGR